jgi:trimethylamine:corrinoid methyltransferase-like protein
VVRYTRLNCQLKKEGLAQVGLAGYPLDIAPPLQMLYSCYLNCCFNEHPGPLMVGHSARVMELAWEISRVMGFKPAIGINPLSPLTCIGDSVDIALDMIDQQPVIHMDPMPVMGITAPLDWYAGWAQAMAESLGGYILFKAAGFKNLHPPYFRIFMPNFASGMTYFSSPQSITNLLVMRQVRAFFGLGDGLCGLLMTAAKEPDQHAAAEKTSGALLARVHGFTSVCGAGNLFMDQIYSPEQLLADIDILNYVNNLGASMPDEDRDIQALVQQGLDSGNYLAADQTLAGFNNFSWRPKVFDLSAGKSGPGHLRRKTREIIDQQIGKYNYELTGDKRKALDRIMVRAQQQLAA